MNEHPSYPSANDDYVTGYLKGLDAGRSINRHGDWVFLGVGVFLGVIVTLLLTIVT